MNRRRALTSAGLALAGLTIFVVAPAYASSASNFPAPDENSYGHLNSVKVDEPAPAGTTVIKAEDLEQQGALAPSSNVAVTHILVADVSRSINTVTWDRERNVLHFYVNDASDELRRQITKTLPESQVWDIIPAARSITELEATIEKIAADPTALPAGLTFVSGTPEADGSSITIGVEGSIAAAFRSAAPPESIADIPVIIVEESRADPAARIRNIAPSLRAAT